MATSRINASVEQVNIPIEDKIPSAGKPFKIVRPIKRSNLTVAQNRISAWIRGAGYFTLSVVDDAADRIRFLKEDHPGYIIAIAGVIGLTCGVALRLKRRSTV